VGCGTIAHSIAIGLASSEHASHLARFGLRLASLSVTRRSECRSSDLASRFPGVVTVRDSAREVVRDSDLVFLCVLPDQVDGVLEELAEGGAWREEDHTLVSLVVRVCFPVYISFLPFASSSCPLPPRSSVVHCVINIIFSPPYPIIIHSRRPKKKTSRRARWRI
jgi:pyrroline-5-carboxylate reductase